MAALRIFSSLPNPRIGKATIAARLGGVEEEVRGASSGELTQRLRVRCASDRGSAYRDLAAAERTGCVGSGNSAVYNTDAFLDIDEGALMHQSRRKDLHPQRWR